MQIRLTSYKSGVISTLALLFLLQSGCYAQIKDDTADPYSWDFGKSQEGEVLKHIFVLKNESPPTLNIKGTNTSCGCTVSEVKKKVLLPGEETSVDVQFDTRGYSGPVRQYIYVYTDNPENPVLRLMIKAKIIKGK